MTANSFLYPRKVTIRRPRAGVEDTDPATPAVGLIVGNIGFSGETGVTTPSDPNGEDTIATGLKASIQFKSPLSRGDNKLPTDTHAPNVWVIMIPAGQGSASVQDRDVLLDEADGRRYEVIAVRHGFLGQHIRSEQLEMS